jgi:hypothetical protein
VATYSAIEGAWMVVCDPEVVNGFTVRTAQVVGWADTCEIAYEAARLLEATGRQPVLDGYRPAPGDLPA